MIKVWHETQIYRQKQKCIKLNKKKTMSKQSWWNKPLSFTADLLTTGFQSLLFLVKFPFGSEGVCSFLSFSLLLGHGVKVTPAEHQQRRRMSSKKTKPTSPPGSGGLGGKLGTQRRPQMTTKPPPPPVPPPMPPSIPPGATIQEPPPYSTSSPPQAEFVPSVTMPAAPPPPPPPGIPGMLPSPLPASVGGNVSPPPPPPPPLPGANLPPPGSVSFEGCLYNFYS